MTIGQIIAAEGVVATSRQRQLDGLLAEMARAGLLDLQERYVELFNRGLGLHLTEYLYGQSRERGGALAELAGLYRARGLELRRGELPSPGKPNAIDN